jgi:hypothetical protein
VAKESRHRELAAENGEEVEEDCVIEGGELRGVSKFRRHLMVFFVAIFCVGCGQFVFYKYGTQNAAGGTPEVCYGVLFSKELMNKFHGIAFAQAKEKGIDLSRYKRFIAVHSTSRSDPNRKIIGLRFSSYRCDEVGLDGGGFDAEIDSSSHTLIDSYTSIN